MHQQMTGGAVITRAVRPSVGGARASVDASSGHTLPHIRVPVQHSAESSRDTSRRPPKPDALYQSIDWTSLNRFQILRTTAAGAVGEATPRSHADANTSAQSASVPLLRSIHRIRHAARHVRHRHLLALASPWPVISTIANVFNVVYALLSLYLGEAAVPGEGKVLLGLAAALEWFALCQYLKYNGNYYLMVRTFLLAYPYIAKNILGALPVYMAFTVFGCLAFGSMTERFDGISWSSITFFAVANGDVVRETFQSSMYYEEGWALRLMAQLFMYLFSAVFIYCILKTTTAINEQSYLLVRPLPEGATKGARAEDLPMGQMEADSAPLAFRLPKRARRMLAAMESVRQAGGSLRLVVESAAKSMPRKEPKDANGLQRGNKSGTVPDSAGKLNAKTKSSKHQESPQNSGNRTRMLSFLVPSWLSHGSDANTSMTSVSSSTPFGSHVHASVPRRPSLSALKKPLLSSA
jgi:hypothetical protein